MSLPTGTVTFLFTDIEGSTKLWEAYPQAMRHALARHDELLHKAIEDNNGVVFKTVGDAFCAAFATASDALHAALASHLLLLNEKWEETDSLRVRIALHTGEAQERDGDYFGQTLNRVARLQSTGYGQQTLLSQTTYDLVRDSLPTGTTLHDLGTHRLKDLQRPEQIFQLLHPDLPAAFPPLKSLDNPELPNNLPQQVTSFIGREKEIEAVKTLLDKTHLLTLTGSGGCGKTRLALQVAAEVLDNYHDGVWLVEQAPLADPALVPQSIAQALGIAEEPGTPLAQTLTNALKDKKLLLVLDNCEHVLDACARVADALMRACPQVRILASSREGLGIAGETVYRIPSLSLPDLKPPATPASLSAYEAVRLFVERATAALPAFTVTNANAPALAQVCVRLDGIPLAIELAAARVRSLSVEEINNKLDNRFRLLTGGSRTALPRQQTLRALIDWSFDLLNDQEKTLLCRLSVFAGGWTLEAAEAVGAGESIEEWEVLDLLTSLADKSLVLAQTQGETTRYELLETVRQYARDRLGERGETRQVRACHADYFLRLAEEIKPKLNGSEQGQWLGVLEAEHDNLRQALTWYGEDTEDVAAGEEGLRMGAALHPFWQVRGHLSEGRERLGALLGHGGGQERTKARADALNGAGVLAWLQGDYAAARVPHEESLTIQRELGDKQGISVSLNNLGNIVWLQEDYAGARVLYEESLSILRELGNQLRIAISLNNLGSVANRQGDYVRARVLHEESLTIQRELRNKQGISMSLNNLGNVAWLQGDYAAARVLYEESLTIARELGNKVFIAYGLEAFASIALREADEPRCARLWGAAAALRETIGSPLSLAEHEEQEGKRTEVWEKLSEDAFAFAWEQGHAMTMEQAIAYALEEADNQ